MAENSSHNRSRGNGSNGSKRKRKEAKGSKKNIIHQSSRSFFAKHPFDSDTEFGRFFSINSLLTNRLAALAKYCVLIGGRRVIPSASCCCFLPHRSILLLLLSPSWLLQMSKAKRSNEPYRWTDADIETIKKAWYKGNTTPASIEIQLGWMLPLRCSNRKYNLRNEGPTLS